MKHGTNLPIRKSCPQKMIYTQSPIYSLGGKIYVCNAIFIIRNNHTSSGENRTKHFHINIPLGILHKKLYCIQSLIIITARGILLAGFKGNNANNIVAFFDRIGIHIKGHAQTPLSTAMNGFFFLKYIGHQWLHLGLHRASHLW